MNPKQAEEIIDLVTNKHRATALRFAIGKMEPGDYQKAKGFLEGVAYRDRVFEAFEILVWELVTHPVFTEGTISCEKLPAGVMQRLKNVREALEFHQKWKEGKP